MIAVAQGKKASSNPFDDKPIGGGSGVEEELDPIQQYNEAAYQNWNN